MHLREKGFTLIELLIVVIIIGILASIAVPQFTTAVERAKSAKAIRALEILSQAEKLWRAETGTYLDLDILNGLGLTEINAYIDTTDVLADEDWGYSVWALDEGGFIATAQRMAGPNITETITLDQNGTLDTTNWSP